MEASRAPRRWTFEEFNRLPGPEDDGKRREIIAGQLVVTATPFTRHQAMVYRLTRLLGGFVELHDLGWVLPGPLAVLFAEGDFLEPDLVFVRKDRRKIISERGIEAAPDLVVEILSPSTAARDRGIKRERYALYGVPEYWIVDAEHGRISVYRPGANADGEPAQVATDVLHWQPVADGPALDVPVSDITRPLGA